MVCTVCYVYHIKFIADVWMLKELGCQTESIFPMALAMPAKSRIMMQRTITPLITAPLPGKEQPLVVACEGIVGELKFLFFNTS